MTIMFKTIILFCVTCFIFFFFFYCQSDMVKKLEITYPDGKLWQTGYMEFDEFGYKKECGLWTFYYKNGLWIYWRPDGETMYEVTYNNGVPVSVSESS